MIPRTLHFIWVGSPIPARFASNIKTWHKHHLDWNISVWTDLNRPRLDNENLYQNARLYVPRDAVGQFRADVMRYELLYRYGGFYADVDTYPLRAIDAALDGLSEFAVYEDATWVANTYLGAEPEHLTFRKLIDALPLNAERNAGKAATVVSGPQFFTPIWIEGECHISPETERWFPYSWRDVRAGRTVEPGPDAYATHEWAHSEGKR